MPNAIEQLKDVNKIIIMLPHFIKQNTVKCNLPKASTKRKSRLIKNKIYIYKQEHTAKISPFKHAKID